MSGPKVEYRGRFAPSPTGPLHLGSLIAAVASYLDARFHCGQWLLRMEDLDPPREEAGAAQRIINSLQQHGLDWDEPPVWQSQRLPAYDAILGQLEQNGYLFRCDCTRAMMGPDGACRGRCLERPAQVTAPWALRVAVPRDHTIDFTDQLQGPQHTPLGRELPDFVLRRKDGLHAYQLAVVVDDADQGITHVVRGSDLLDSTARQIFLQQLLQYPTPHYCHVPVITDRDGKKFSKQNHAPALDDAQAPGNLRQALAFLDQPAPPRELAGVSQILDHAVRHWAAGRIPARLGIAATTDASK